MDLSAEDRDRLADSDFAVPAKRELPIHDAEHARLAWDMLDRTAGLTDDERAAARARIVKALHQFGIRIGHVQPEEERQATFAQLPDPIEYAKDTGAAAGSDARLIREAEDGGHLIDVTIIRPGVSNNGYNYTEAVLREATDLWQGAPAFVDHPTALDQTRAGGRSLRDLVGVYENPRYDRGIRAQLHLFNTREANAAFETIREALAARQARRAAPPIGISADWTLLKSPARGDPEGTRKARYDVHAITRVNSGDLVIRPSAGGAFDRILEAAEPISYEEKKMPPTVTPNASAETGTVITAPGVENGAGAMVREAMLPNDDTRLADELAAIKRELAGARLDATLATSGLPAPARAQLRKSFEGRVFEAGELDAAIGAFKGMLGEIFGQQAIRGVGAALAAGDGVRVGATPLERIQAAFDRLFGLEVEPRLADVPRLSGIREAYIAITGDKFFTGRYNWEESVVREANETTSSVMANVVLNSMTKRLVKDYQAQPKWWEPIAIKVPVLDMKQQNRIRLSDFASLASVSEAAAYANIAWGDSRENYTPSKFGNIVAVTLEMFLNDDLRAVQRIPTKLAHAAVVTLNEQVAGLFTQSSGTGPAMSDTFHVFDATNHQGNTSTSTSYDLSQTALQSAMTVLEKMTNTAGKRIGVKGRWLLIPPDLRWTAQVITQSTYVTASANNDVNPMMGQVIPIVVPQLTTAYQWYLLADPTQVESIEIGFLNGREEPELMVQDNPTAGSVFTNDEISYKVRHIYGLGWLDYRGAFAALPAS